MLQEKTIRLFLTINKKSSGRPITDSSIWPLICIWTYACNCLVHMVQDNGLCAFIINCRWFHNGWCSSDDKGGFMLFSFVVSSTTKQLGDYKDGVEALDLLIWSTAHLYSFCSFTFIFPLSVLFTIFRLHKYSFHIVQ